MSTHMTPEQFREYGKQVIDWVADYLRDVESYPVRSPVRPGDVRAALPADPPEQPEPFEDVLADLRQTIMPGITHWQHPNFFAYFPANASGPAILGDLLGSGLGVQGMVWATSPACTELETVVVDWLVELLGLPDHFRTDSTGGGSIQGSASSASLVAALAALHRASAGSAPTAGLRGRYTLYASAHAHSSVEKAARIIGVGAENLRLVDVDKHNLGMDPTHLEELVTNDLANGATPAFVCATIGTTSTTAIDSVPEVGAVCRRYGAWLHVDAAYAGVSAVCPDMRWINKGVAECADSYVTNPHKWLLTNFDCSVLWMADRQPMIDALSIMPEYLRNSATESGQVIDYRDWQIPLGRRFRALKLWSVIRWYGAEGLRDHIRSSMTMADEFTSLVRDDAHFVVLEPHHFGLVCFRPLWTDKEDQDAANASTMALMQRLNDSGTLYLSHTKVAGYVLLRMAIGAPSTLPEHVRTAWQRIRAEYHAMRVSISDE